MGLADTALMLQAERDRERREADRQTRLAQERLKALHAAEARYADALGEIKNAVELAEAGNVTGCLFMLSTYLEGVAIAEEQVEAKGKDVQ